MALIKIRIRKNKRIYERKEEKTNVETKNSDQKKIENEGYDTEIC